MRRSPQTLFGYNFNGVFFMKSYVSTRSSFCAPQGIAALAPLFIYLLLLSLPTLGAVSLAATFAKSQDEIVYRLAPFDLVELSVYGQADLRIRQRVSDEGTLFLPLLGGVSIGGETVAHVSDLIERLYIERGYLRAPVVSINIEEFSPKVVTVLGEVESPGTVEIPPGRNSIPILVAVAGVGGFTGMAKLAEVQVKTTGAGSSRLQLRTVNINKALEAIESGSGESYLAKPDDIVFVPKRVF
ncbi:MAG: protein involved in polysaccharide export with SLBB domain [Lentimonas sp.]|jgi:protein involved in polysaccharide export with SLBB domain